MGPGISITKDKEKSFGYSPKGRSTYLQYGSCSMQGIQRNNDDRVLIFPGKSSERKNDQYDCFTVIDGYGSENYMEEAGNSKFCKDNFQKCLEDNYSKSKSTKRNILTPLSDQQIENTYIMLDEKLKSHVDSQDDNTQAIFNVTGCGCASIFITPRTKSSDEIICSNIGRCEAIYYSEDGSHTKLTKCHSSQDIETKNPSEFERVKKAGGQFQSGVLNGVVETTRAFGDFNRLKNKRDCDPLHQTLTCVPEITRNIVYKRIRTKTQSCGYSFILLGSSGMMERVHHCNMVRNNEFDLSSFFHDFITNRLDEQERGTYYQNEMKRTMKMLKDCGKPDTPLAGYTVQIPTHEEMLPPKKGFDLDGIAGELCDHVMFNFGVKQNVSCVIILLNGGRGNFCKDRQREYEMDLEERVAFLGYRHSLRNGDIGNNKSKKDENLVSLRIGKKRDICVSKLLLDSLI